MCLDCGAGGDVFAFVMGVYGCNFLDALRIVAEFSGGSERFAAGVACKDTSAYNL